MVWKAHTVKVLECISTKISLGGDHLLSLPSGFQHQLSLPVKTYIFITSIGIEYSLSYYKAHSTQYCIQHRKQHLAKPSSTPKTNRSGKIQVILGSLNIVILR